VAASVIALGIGAFFFYRTYKEEGELKSDTVVFFAVLACFMLALGAWLYWYGNRPERER
jgi:hypothetical protein